MQAAISALRKELPVSCGTLIVNKNGELLLCHVTGTNHWDIPKGMRDVAESTLAAAIRELREETDLEFDESLFEEIGGFDYLKTNRLHLYKLYAPESLDSLDHLVCTSHFPHHVTGKPTPEMDGFRWASRDDIRTLCRLPLSQLLLSLDW